MEIIYEIGISHDGTIVKNVYHVRSKEFNLFNESLDYFLKEKGFEILGAGVISSDDLDKIIYGRGFYPRPREGYHACFVTLNSNNDELVAEMIASVKEWIDDHYNYYSTLKANLSKLK